MRKKYVVLAGISVALTVGFAGLAYAAVYWQFTPYGSQVRFWGWNAHEIIIDPEGTVEEFDHEPLFYLNYSATEPCYAGVATGHPSHPRAAVLVQRMNTGANGDDAKAWMNSSAGAKVEVCTNGDVEITLGE